MPELVPAEPKAAPSLLVSGEKLLSPAAAAKASNLPGQRGGTCLNGSTIFRHITKGVRAPNGELIRLEAVRMGHRWLTSLEALARFADRLAAASLAAIDSTSSPAPVETPKQRRTAADRASREADAIFGAAN